MILLQSAVNSSRRIEKKGVRNVPTYFIYPIYTAVIGLAFVLIVPKGHFRQNAIYAITFGGAGSVAIILAYSTINAFDWLNMGPFGLGSVPLFPPLAWTLYFSIYFYILPRTKPWIYLFVFFTACYSTLLSNVFMNLEILRWNRGRLALPFFIYFTWFAAVTWIYTRIMPTSLHE